MTIESFVLLLAVTTVLRGFAAGFISGLALMDLPVRKRIGLVPHADFVRAQYKGHGVKVYAGATVLGALLTLVITFQAFFQVELTPARWSIVVSLIATALGFVGTSGAFPTMLKLWQASDKNEAQLSKLLDRFAGWHIFGAFWHVIAFIALVVALAN